MYQAVGKNKWNMYANRKCMQNMFTPPPSLVASQEPPVPRLDVCEFIRRRICVFVRNHNAASPSVRSRIKTITFSRLSRPDQLAGLQYLRSFIIKPVERMIFFLFRLHGYQLIQTRDPGRKRRDIIQR